MPQGNIDIKKEVGFIISVRDYLIYLEGLPSVKVNDIIVSEKNARALVTSLDNDRVEALMLDKARPKPDDVFYQSEKGITLPLGPYLFGRTINSLGKPLDGRGKLLPGKYELALDVVASGISSREPILEQLETGVSLVDTLIPIGKGQRELIIGEQRSGKTAFVLDVIINQKDKGILCIYTSMGKPEVDTRRFVKELESAGSEHYTIILAASSSESAPLIAITPSVAFAIAEHFRAEDKDVLLVLDDLGTHAKYLREIALLSGRVPGRESYPGDIFYQHAHLMERAGNFNSSVGGGSITLLPVMETDIENFSNLIQTNLMASTDGHLLFSAALRSQGQYPAISIDRSVTRVGRQTQSHLHKSIADKLRSLLAEYSDFKSYSRFGTELSSGTQLALKLGELTSELLKQEPLELVDLDVQILLLSLIYTPFLQDNDLEFLRRNKTKIIFTLSNASEFKQIMSKFETLSLDEIIKEVKENISVLEAICQ